MSNVGALPLFESLVYRAQKDVAVDGGGRVVAELLSISVHLHIMHYLTPAAGPCPHQV